jgi:hypothetical protein
MVDNKRISIAMRACGLLPDSCWLMELDLSRPGGAAVRYEKILTADELLLVSEALAIAARMAINDPNGL